MLKEYQYANGIKIKIWLDELPIQECELITIIESEYQAESQDLQNKQIVVELKIPRNISNYGMLGVKYRNNATLANVQIYVSKYDEEIYAENIAIKPDVVHKGIPKNYVNGIINSIELNNGMLLKNGYYEFHVGAHGEVGSSEKIFFILTNIILKLLSKKDFTKDTIEKIIKEELC